jgi:peroxiredoxin Q/BCP
MHSLASRLTRPLALVALLASGAVAHAGPPAIGSAAPDFRLQDQNGKWHSLEQYRGKWVVLYFYPKDQTPGCTTQACELRDNIFAFRHLGATILGISVDDVASHKEFAEKHSLPFSILADSDKRTTKDYGVLTRYMGVLELAQRDTFIIDPQGRVAQHWAKVDPKGHSERVLAELRSLQARATPAATAPAAATPASPAPVAPAAPPPPAAPAARKAG